MRDSEERYRRLVEMNPDAICLVRNDRVEFANPAALRLVGASALDEVAGKPILPFIHPDSQPQAIERRNQLLAGLKEANPPIEQKIVRLDGAIRDVEVSSSVIHEHGRPALIQAVMRDVTERKLAQRALTESQSKLRELTAHLERVREEERTRIARELHDGLGATLAAIKLDLVSAVETLNAHPNATAARIRRASELVQTLVVSTHQIIDDLRPSVLDLGLWAAIDWLAEQLTNRTGIACEVAIDEALHDHELERDRASALFRIVQESLTNVAKHADATRLHITAWYEEGGIVIEIEDDGRGVTEQDLFKINRWGLVGMHERARSFGGEVTVSGARNQGTTVRVRMPRANAARDSDAGEEQDASP